jgi:dihydroorotate dehydrogenase electron transfer subunit
MAPGYYKIVVKAEQLARFSLPGQFCQISILGVFLRRPLSIAGAASGKLKFIYKVAGAGTQILSQMKKGGKIEALGPLGAGYPLEAAKNKTPVLIAGGSGIASLSFLAQKLIKPGIIFFGAKNKAELVNVSYFKKLGWEIVVATEDASAGVKGYITSACANHFKKNACSGMVIFACGPSLMLKKVAELARAHKIEGYSSLEEKMACGTGICQGCAVSIKGEYKRACTDGPVFNLNDVNW